LDFGCICIFIGTKLSAICTHSLACDALSQTFRGEIDIFGNGIGGDNGL
jgi:hypothetical protein